MVAFQDGLAMQMNEPVTNFKYGYIGFCLLIRKSVRNTIGNVILCFGCSHFVPSKKGVR